MEYKIDNKIIQKRTRDTSSILENPGSHETSNPNILHNKPRCNHTITNRIAEPLCQPRELSVSGNV